MVTAEMPARRRALVVAGTITAVTLCVAVVTLSSDWNSEQTVMLESHDMSNQLRKAESFFSKAQPVPDITTKTSPVQKVHRIKTGLGLHGMSQKQFEKMVESEVTSKVATVLLTTMRPLKKVLREQQEKIDELEHKHGQETKAEKRIAERLSTDLKTGLLSHLKTDVDVELQRKLTPGFVGEAEKAKAAALRKLKGKRLQQPPADHAKGEDSTSQDVRSAVTHSMNSALNGVYKREAEHRGSRGRKTDEAKATTGKGKCDPLRNLYKNGVVSWC